MRPPALIFINVNRNAAPGLISFAQGGGWKIGDEELMALLLKSPEYRLVDDAPTDVAGFRRTSN